MIFSAYNENHHGYLDDNLVSREVRVGEFEFWVKEAGKAGGPVLELASGAGRMLMVLAGAGIEVIGLEASGFMIDKARKAISRLETNAQRRIKIIQGDMRRFRFGRKFNLIIVPFNSFWYNFRRCFGNYDPIKHFPGYMKAKDLKFVYRQAENCLGSMMDTLASQGVFMIDTPIWWENFYFSYGAMSARWWNYMAGKYNFDWTLIAPYRDFDSVIKVLVGRKLN